MKGSLILILALVNAIVCTLLYFIVNLEISFELFFIMTIIVLLIDLIILRKTLSKASVKIKNRGMVTLASVCLRLQVFCGYLLVFTNM